MHKDVVQAELVKHGTGGKVDRDLNPSPSLAPPPAPLPPPQILSKGVPRGDAGPSHYGPTHTSLDPEFGSACPEEGIIPPDVPGHFYEIVRLIDDKIERTGRGPSQFDLGESLGKSQAWVSRELIRMARAGMLFQEAGKWRSMAVPKKLYQAIRVQKVHFAPAIEGVGGSSIPREWLEESGIGEGLFSWTVPEVRDPLIMRLGVEKGSVVICRRQYYVDPYVLVFMGIPGAYRLEVTGEDPGRVLGKVLFVQRGEA